MFQKLSNWLKTLQKGNEYKLSDALQDLVDGNILVRKFFQRQYLLIITIAIFFILYIGNRYECEKSMRRERELIKEITDRRYELLSISAELTKRSRCSVIEDSITSRIPELVLTKKPPIVIQK